MDKTTITMPHSPIKANESSIAVRKMIQDNNDGISVTNGDHNHQRDRSRCARCGRQKGDEVGVNNGGSCTFCRSRVITHPPHSDDNVVTVEPIYDVTTSISNDLYDETYVQNGKSNGNCATSGGVPRIGRKWRYFPGKNRFYCEGRIMTAPSIRFCVLSFGLIIVTFALFIAFDGPYLAKNLTLAIPIVGGLLFISVVVNMLKTSCSDPGILPRASQQESEYIEKSYGDANNSRPPPRTKDIVVNGQTVKSKYCFTCKMFRPPRASHCGVCDNCVDRFDHHCPFLGNCIGKRNYRSFYAFIVSLSLLAVFVLSCSITHLALLSKEKNGGFLEALKETPTSAVVIFISFVGMWTVIGLAGFHTYLIAMEQTTNEDIKGMFGRANSKNPYSRGNFCQNCCFVLCGPAHPSLIDPRGYATLDFLASLPKASDPNGTASSNKCNAPGSLKPNCGEVRGTLQNPNQIQTGAVQNNMHMTIGGGGNGQGMRPAHGLPTSPTSPQVANSNGKILTSNHHQNSQKTPVNSGNSGVHTGQFPTYLREQRLKTSRDHIESTIHQGSSMVNQQQEYTNLNPQQMRGYPHHDSSTFGRNGGPNGHLSDSASSSSSSLCEHSLNNGPGQGHVSLSMVKIEFDTPTMTRDGASTSSSRTNNVRDSRSIVSTSSSIPSTSGAYPLQISGDNKKDASCPHSKNQYHNIQTNIHNSTSNKGRLDNTMINSPLHLDTIM